MAKHHGTRDQKRAAKQKAKRMAKRSAVLQRTSSDPTVRLQRVEKWPVVHARVAENIWAEGIGHLLIVRRDSEGVLVFAAFLVDVYCLGIKNAFWRTGTVADIEDLVKKIERSQKMRETKPACLSKIVKGAVEYAQAFGFSPHPDYRHASKLLDGIDPSTCPTEFTFGHDGRPYYIQGPNESPAQAEAIAQLMQSIGGHFLVSLPRDDDEDLSDFDPDPVLFEAVDSIFLDG